MLTRGLIAKADSPDEVAGVLAHEMGHGIEMHPETALVRALGLSAAAELMLGGSGGTLANIGIVLAQLSYTRDAERNADRHALEILKGAGVSAQGLAEFFTRVTKLEEDEIGIATAYRHPAQPSPDGGAAALSSKASRPTLRRRASRPATGQLSRRSARSPKPTDI